MSVPTVVRRRNYLQGNGGAYRPRSRVEPMTALATGQAERHNGRASPFGTALKRWRAARGVSQLSLALDAGISSRHLSFVETGRSEPSRPMVLRLAEALDLPLRERNSLLQAAGYAPLYRARTLDDADMAQVRRAIDIVLAGHEPFPALVIDRWFNLIAANSAALRIVNFLGVAAEPPLNLLRLILHPDQLRPYIVNWEEVAWPIVLRAKRELEAFGADEEASRLLEEILSYPGVPQEWHVPAFDGEAPPFLAMTFEKDGARLSWFSTISTFGTAQDVTLQELHIENLYPADPETEQFARQHLGADA